MGAMPYCRNLPAVRQQTARLVERQNVESGDYGATWCQCIRGAENGNGRTNRSARSLSCRFEIELYWRSSQVMLTSTWTSVPPDWKGTEDFAESIPAPPPPYISGMMDGE